MAEILSINADTWLEQGNLLWGPQLYTWFDLIKRSYRKGDQLAEGWSAGQKLTSWIGFRLSKLHSLLFAEAIVAGQGPLHPHFKIFHWWPRYIKVLNQFPHYRMLAKAQSEWPALTRASFEGWTRFIGLIMRCSSPFYRLWCLGLIRSEARSRSVTPYLGSCQST